jgi:hypothetical protein
MTAARAATLVLWDVDHTLIENSGVSKENYALAFKLLTGREPEVIPQEDTAVVIADDDSSGLVITAVIPTDHVDAFMPTVNEIINSLSLE